MDGESFVQLLEHVLTPDTRYIKQATATLRRDYYSKPEAVPALFQLLRTHQNPQVRQLAAVEARNLIPQFWGAKDNNVSPGIPSELKPQLRESILQSTISESNSLVKHSSARVISSIAKIDLPMGEWLGLLGFLLQAASSGEAENREVGVYILFTLLESLEEAVADRWRDFLPLFSRTINDRESMAVRLNTLLALGKMAEFLNTEEHADGVAAFKEVLPAMVAVLKESIDTGDEEKANPAFEVFQTLLIVDGALVSSHFGDLVQFFSDMSVSKDVDDDFRSKALSFLISCLRYKKLKMQALKIGEQLTLRALEIVTEFKDIEDTDDMTPSRSALGLLDYLSSSLPPSQVIVPLLNTLPNYIASRDPEYRKAAVLALGMCVEGAPEFIATQISSIFPLVLNLLSDPEARVRQAALHTVSQLADDLAEDMGKEHARLIPALIGMLDSDDGPIIWKAACNAIDAVFAGTDRKDVEGYLPSLMPRLSLMFQKDDIKLKAAVVGGIGSSAQAAKGSFTPYFAATMGALSPFISATDSEDELDLRGVVVDAMGAIAEAVGMQAFTRYVEPLMRSTMEALKFNHPRLRETSFMFFSIMSKVYEEEFTPFLPEVTSALFQSLEQTETDVDVENLAAEAVITSVGASGSQKVLIGEGVQAEIQANIDEDDEDEDALWDELTAVNAVALEKEVAAEVLGEVLSHCKQGYLPYLEKTVELLALKAQHPYEGVRKASISTLWRAYAAFWQVSQEKGMEKWLPGLPLKVRPPPELERLGNVVIDCTLANWKNESDRSSVTEICQNIAETLKLCGPAFLVDATGAIILELSSQLVLILQKQHVCQLDSEDEEVPELNESSEYDWLLVESAMDVAIGLAMALGPQFKEMWKLLGSTLIKYASSSEAVERSTSVGVIADCIKYMEEGCSEYTTQLMKVFLHRLSDEDPEAKSNAAYAIGMLCLNSLARQVVIGNYGSILSKLEPLLQVRNHRMLDNACGCIARMIMAHPNNVHLADVLPVLAGVLPLKEDYEENEPIYKMLVQLYKNSDQTVFRMTEQFVPIIASVLSPPEGQLTGDTRKQLAELVKFLYRTDPGVLQGYDNLISLAKSSN